MNKIVYLKPSEFQWVNNFLRVAKKDKYVKYVIMNKYHDSILIDYVVQNYPKIDNDGHSGYTFQWTLLMANQVLTTNSIIRKHKFGKSYIPPWCE